MISPFEGARWIWNGVPHYDLQNGYCLLRKTFELPAIPAAAPLFITADQSYQLYINGEYICRGPARGFQNSWPYDEIDVAPFLRVGENVLAIRAYHPGCSTFSYISQQMAGVLVAAHWNLSGIEYSIRSGGDWKAWRQISVRRDTLPVSIQLFPQEQIYLRAEPLDWMNAGFDDAAWGVSAMNGHDCPPWNSLEARGIPLLHEEFAASPQLVAQNEGECAPNFRDVREVVRLAFDEGLEHSTTFDATIWKDGVLVVAPGGEGRFRSFVFDFGRVLVGNLELTIEGAQGGEIVDALYCEVTREDDANAPTQTPWYDPNDGCLVALGTRLVCREDENHHAFYHINGFRFLTLRVLDARTELKIVPRLRTVGYPLEHIGRFESSDALFEQIWEACAHTEQICALDAYVDTPWREQAQWWGDARVQAWNTFHLCDDARLLRRGIGQIGAQQLPNGLTYGHAPTIAHTCVLPDFTLVWMLTQWDYYFQTGSLEAFRSQQAPTARALEYFRAQTDQATGLLRCDSRYWLFLDWTCLPKDGISAILNCWLVLALEKLVEMHELCGETERAGELKAWANRLREALEKLITNGLLNDGYTPDGALRETFSIHAQTLALMLNLRGLDERKAVEDVLLPMTALEVLPDHDREILPSAYWVTYVFSVLGERGYGTDVLRFIHRHWEPMARFGSTWESYADRLHGGSRSHAWSAHPIFHLAQTIGGLTQTAPRWGKVRFAPVFAGEYGGATVPTPHGNLVSRWEKSGEVVQVSLQIPNGIEVGVKLPGIETTCAAGHWNWQDVKLTSNTRS